MSKLDRLSWYYNRLFLMSPVEIKYRLNNKYKTVKEKIHLKSKKNTTFQIKNINNFLFELADLEYIKNFYANNPEDEHYLFSKANKILEHKFSFFNLTDKYLGEKINWHKDYMSDKSCDLVFYADVDYKDYQKNGDIKYIWETNRFKQLYVLSQAYCISRDEKYAQEIIAEIDDWINENPYLTGVNWTSSLELAIRLIAWGWAIYSLNLAGWNIEESFKNKLSQSIYQQADYISNHLSAFSSANNHLIGEAAGLCITGCLFDFGAKSNKWKKTGYEILLNELDKQFFADGVNKEQTLSYHCFVFDFYLLSFLTMKKNGTNIPAYAWKKLEKIAEVIFRFTDDNLNLPNIGDSDDGYVVDLTHNPNGNNSQYLLNISSILFKRGDFKQKAGNLLDEKTIWLLDPKTCSQYQVIQPAISPKESFHFDHSGYVILKDENTDAVMDVGPLGYLSIAAHGHADALSLCVNYKNEEFLIDPGTYAYHTKKLWRNYFKGTSAHNTVEVDGLNQSEISGNFMWGQKADVKVDNIILKSEFNYIKASHNGYLKQKAGVTHIREVLFVKNEFLVIKDLMLNQNKTPHNYCLNWHFAENCNINQKNNDHFIISKKENTLDLRVFSNEECLAEVLVGNGSQMAGWASTNYDKKYPINTLKASVKSLNNTCFISVMDFNDLLEGAVYQQEALTISTKNNYYTFNPDEDLYFAFEKYKHNLKAEKIKNH